MIQVEIMIKGEMDTDWSEYFGDFGITHAAGNSVLLGPVRDQSELRGILTCLADLGLELVSVNTLSNLHVPERPVKGGDDYKTENSSLRYRLD